MCLNLNVLYVEFDLEKDFNNKINLVYKVFLVLLENIEDLFFDELEEVMVDSVYDWLDVDSIIYCLGVEEDEYLLWDYFYMIVNSYFVFLFELCLIKGFNLLVMEKILLFVCVILGSEFMVINVNMLLIESVIILSLFIEGFSFFGVEIVLLLCFEKGFDDLEVFFEEVN